jgi:crotonobetainyl-CoA:carnitine CoA-transferase CaiB-like acyl-CoA transferase
MVAEVEHAKAGRQKTLGVPLKMSVTPASVRRAAPTLGHMMQRSAQGGETQEWGRWSR